MAVQRGIQKATERAVEEIKNLSKPVKGDAIAQIGTISANGDRTIGELIAEAMNKVGKDGVITVEESKTKTVSISSRPKKSAAYARHFAHMISVGFIHRSNVPRGNGSQDHKARLDFQIRRSRFDPSHAAR